MRSLFPITPLCLTLVLANGHWATAQDVKPARHNWSSIRYPHLPIGARGSVVPGFIVLNGKDGLELVIWYSFREDDKDQEKLPPVKKVLARLHSTDGEVIDSKPGQVSVEGDLGMMEYSYNCRFPWARNVLAEAWIEIRLPEQTYWVEVPYGFTRNPADSLNPARSRHGRPKYPPTMKPGKTDWLVPWLEVSYDSVKVQNGWSMWLNVANSFSPRFEVVLYRDDFKEGRNEHRWNLDSPCTQMEIKVGKGSTLECKRMSIRLHDDRMRRSDCFKLKEIYGGNTRRWGAVVVGIDGKSFEFIVPSSLFWDAHGATDPGDFYKAFVPRLSDQE